MKRMLSSLVVVWGFFVLVPGTSIAGKPDLVVEVVLPGAEYLGSYNGAKRITVGEVRDQVFADTPSFLGMGLEARYPVRVPESREATVRQLTTDFLRTTSLLADEPREADYVLDVTIRRGRFHLRKATKRGYLRSEIFVEFAFRGGDRDAQQVLACGNAEVRAQILTRKKMETAVKAGFVDVFQKLAASTTLSDLLGSGWVPSVKPVPQGEKENPIFRISRDKAYGPTDHAREMLAVAPAELRDLNVRHLRLEDFEISDEDYLKREDADPGFAKRYLSATIREHLDSFFPGVFDSIELGDGMDGSETLVVSGDLQRLKFGSFSKRKWVGMGAGKDKLDVDCFLRPGGSQEAMVSLDMRSSNWGAGWQGKRGSLRDMADQTARDVAFYLVQTLAPDYTYPHGLEVLFDDLPYPPAAD